MKTRLEFGSVWIFHRSLKRPVMGSLLQDMDCLPETSGPCRLSEANPPPIDLYHLASDSKSTLLEPSASAFSSSHRVCTYTTYTARLSPSVGTQIHVASGHRPLETRLWPGSHFFRPGLRNTRPEMCTLLSWAVQSVALWTPSQNRGLIWNWKVFIL
jgi:hypothetical protein